MTEKPWTCLRTLNNCCLEEMGTIYIYYGNSLHVTTRSITCRWSCGAEDITSPKPPPESHLLTRFQQSVAAAGEPVRNRARSGGPLVALLRSTRTEPLAREGPTRGAEG